MSSNTLIGGDTLVTVPEGTVAALTKLGVDVSGFGSANLSFDAAGDLLADFPITGGYDGAYDVILHQGSGLTFSDSHGSITVSDFRIDTQTDVVYGDVTLKTGSTSVSENNVDIFSIGAGLSLTFTNDAIAAVNEALGSSLTTAVPVGTAAPHPVANPLPTSFEEFSLVRDLFNDYGFQGQTQPIVGGHTDVTLTSAATLAVSGFTSRRSARRPSIRRAPTPSPSSRSPAEPNRARATSSCMKAAGSRSAPAAKPSISKTSWSTRSTMWSTPT